MRRRMIPWVALHAGCAAVPDAALVEPTEVLAGETLRVTGRGLDRSEIRLGTRVLLTEDRGETGLLARIPRDAPPGRFTLGLIDARGEHLTDLHVTVLSDHACTNEFRSNTRISVAKQTVVLDRYWPDGRRQSWTLGPAEVSVVEIAAIPMPDGHTCSAIFLRRTAGGRLLYDDDSTEDLTERAHTIAEMLNVPVTIASPP
jgi:hypothetical protein